MTTARRDARTILIAGSEGHLGLAAVTAFARRGLAVAASCRTADDERRVRAHVESEGLRGVTTLVCDLGDDAQVQRLAGAAADALGGRIEALLNAAGGFRWAMTADLSVADFDFLLAANLRSSFLLARHVLPRMRAQDFGRMVFVSSRATLGLGEPGTGAYAASKAALNALVESMAAEVKGSGVTVNAVAPAMIDTPANRRDMPKADTSKWVTPEALLDVAWMMMSAAGEPLNGAILPVSGGL